MVGKDNDKIGVWTCLHCDGRRIVNVSSSTHWRAWHGVDMIKRSEGLLKGLKG